MESLPNYDAWKLASPPEGDDDELPPLCCGEDRVGSCGCEAPTEWDGVTPEPADDQGAQGDGFVPFADFAQQQRAPRVTP